jgi:NADH dehydrogenase (ubiquinone) flavoprotein 2
MSAAAQPDNFEFTAENLSEAKKYIARYPEGRQASAILPLLDLAQRQCDGWLPRVALEHVGEILDMALIRIYEVATFYEMYNLEPVGAHMVRVCTTTPCQLCGASGILDVCRDELGIELGGTSADGKFTLKEFECLGACVNAPIVWIDDDYYEDLDEAKIRDILKRFRAGETPEPGSQTGRQKSAPASGATTLKDVGGE